MKPGDFTAREAFFLLALMAVGVGISWLCVAWFTDTVAFLGSSAFWIAYILTNGF